MPVGTSGTGTLAGRSPKARTRAAAPQPRPGVTACCLDRSVLPRDDVCSKQKDSANTEVPVDAVWCSRTGGGVEHGSKPAGGTRVKEQS